MIVTRRAETAPAGSVRRSRIEHGPPGRRPDVFFLLFGPLAQTGHLTNLSTAPDGGER